MSNAAPKPAAPSGRLLSLDVFRGITIAGMLLVNNAGDWGHVFTQLEHAEWHGATFTDMIFPWFLFIMGVAMPFSFAKRLASGAPKSDLLPGVFRRAAILYGLLLFQQTVWWFVSRELSFASGYLRVTGVLGRIGLCYLFASLIYIYTDPRRLWIWVVGLLTGYFALMTFIPVPGHGSSDYSVQGNLASWLDRTILGVRCYGFERLPGGTIRPTQDPEGLLATLPAIGTTLIGVITGLWLRRPTVRPGNKPLAMALAGVGCLLAAFTVEPAMPFNKALWTSSYVLLAAGWGLLAFALCYFLVDDLGWKRGWTYPFVVLGTNAILAYVGVAITAYMTLGIRWAGPDGKNIFLKTYLYNTFYKSWIPRILPDAIGQHVSSMCYGLTYVLAATLLLSVLHRRKIFLKV